MLSETEKLFPVPKAVELATGRRPHPATCFRWRQHGISGVWLETVKLGGKRLTSVEAVHRFVEATTAAADGPRPSTPARTSRQRQAAISKAEAELDAAGI